MPFIAYEKAKRAVEALGPVVRKVKQHDRDLANQLQRAGSSVLLNLAEGAGTDGGRRTASYRIAAGSAAEVRAALDVAQAWGYIGCAQVDGVEAHLDQVRAILWRLTR